MPRFSTTIRDENGKAIGIACGHYRRKRCATCAVLGAELECDGCDKALCTSCSVSPKAGLDFCPSCCHPAWRHWLTIQPSSVASMERGRRRTEFRAWARVAVDVFLKLVPLGAVAKAARR